MIFFLQDTLEHHLLLWVLSLATEPLPSSRAPVTLLTLQLSLDSRFPNAVVACSLFFPFPLGFSDIGLFQVWCLTFWLAWSDHWNCLPLGIHIQKMAPCFLSLPQWLDFPGSALLTPQLRAGFCNVQGSIEWVSPGRYNDFKWNYFYLPD